MYIYIYMPIIIKSCKEYGDKVKECDSLQDQMDGAACKRAVQVKDACEAYAECHFSRKAACLTSADHSSQYFLGVVGG